MTTIVSDQITEQRGGVFACYLKTNQDAVKETQQQQQQQKRCGLEEDQRDHRGKARDRSNIRDEYFLCPSRCKILYLNEDSLDEFADRYGYSKLYYTSLSQPMASYIKGPCHLNFWLKSGTVGCYLNQPRRGKTELFRGDIDTCEAEAIFRNPRNVADRRDCVNNGSSE
mmetsp:Transcript_17820/g.44467  ORF Transcript_17820/g.44467 Transcript_17820/m.44467 type:complete len:169 (+) Transcript_17820:53-559(+)